MNELLTELESYMRRSHTVNTLKSSRAHCNSILHCFLLIFSRLVVNLCSVLYTICLKYVCCIQLLGIRMYAYLFIGYKEIVGIQATEKAQSYVFTHT